MMGFRLDSLRTREAITPEKTVSGLRKLLPGVDIRRDEEGVVSRPVLTLSCLALVTTLWVRWALGYGCLGPDIWVHVAER